MKREDVISVEQIATAIRQVRDEFITDGQAPSYWAINNGLCEDFARDVAAVLGGETNQFYGVGNGNFSVDGDDFSGAWDWKLLQTYWGIKPLMGLTKKQVSAIDFGTHVWLTDGKSHYDAECPDGVPNFFDLPIFRRCIVQELRESGVICDDVFTDDVIATPQCPVANPTLTMAVPELLEQLLSVVDCVVSQGAFSGMVLNVGTEVVTQKINRDGATVQHALSSLSEPVSVGSVVDIKYVGGVGVVGGQGVAAGVER